MRTVGLLLLVVACACPDKPVEKPGSGTATPPPAGGCEAIRSKVEGLYRAEAQQKEPKRVDAAVADNTTMVMNDCAKDAKVIACVDHVSTVAELEAKCLRPIDDEGTEGKELK